MDLGSALMDLGSALMDLGSALELVVKDLNIIIFRAHYSRMAFFFKLFFGRFDPALKTVIHQQLAIQLAKLFANRRAAAESQLPGRLPLSLTGIAN